jgi:hypothetical protein
MLCVVSSQPATPICKYPYAGVPEHSKKGPMHWHACIVSIVIDLVRVRAHTIKRPANRTIPATNTGSAPRIGCGYRVIPVQTEAPAIQPNQVHSDLPQAQLWLICCWLEGQQGTAKLGQPVDAGPLVSSSQQVCSSSQCMVAAETELSWPSKGGAVVPSIGCCSCSW